MCARFRNRARARGVARGRRAQGEENGERPAPAPDHGARPGVPLFLKALPAAASASPDAATQAASFAQHDAGHPLDDTTRTTMESSLGHDLGAVRIHTGAEAADSSRAVGARAYTTGADVVFGAGEYAPSTAEGEHLLAHELTHVVQQSAAPPQAAGAAPTIQRQALPNAPDLTLRPSPTAARLLGSLTLEGFATDSAALTGEHHAALTALAAALRSLLRSYPTGALSVTGHTDATGSEAHNATLGERRALAVTAVLVAEGISSDVISTSSAGEGELREPTPHASPRNRRVEIRFEPGQRGRLVEPLQMPEDKPSTPVNLFPPSALPPETPTEKMKRILQPIPEAPAGPTISQAVLEQLDRRLNKAMEKLGVPDKYRPYVRDAAHSALAAGVGKLRDMALDQLPMGEQEKEALRKAAEAAVQTPMR
jgi:outer membrane protein OmpA-like peptidoglycan-associated protein